MAIIRSFNPIWSYVDLNGKQLDSTYYLFTLQNTLPYLPQPIWRDFNKTNSWDDPIQFLANGTLPENMYWDDSLTYRLEVRNGNTQAAQLIYLIENYEPSSSQTPIPGSSIQSTDNQITNPQFASLNFTGNLVINTATTTNFAPGWSVITTGTGTLTLSQTTYTGSQSSPSNPTNAATGLQLVNNGFSSVELIQRFNGNGALWTGAQSSSADGPGVAFNITASSTGLSTITSMIKYNDGAQDTLLLSQDLNTINTQYNKASIILQSTNASTPDTAWTELSILMVTSTTYELTSIQLVGQQSVEEIQYLQTTPQRQIDETYNTAYPIVPVGTLIDFAGYTTPLHYLLCDGTSYTRTQYPLLFSAITLQVATTLTNATNTFTIANASTILYIGMSIEGNGIPASTSITNLVGTTVTISNNATITGASTITFIPWGAADTTHFNVPDLRGYTTAGANDSLFYTSIAGDLPNGVGLKGGSSKQTLTGANMPATVGFSSGAAGNVVLNSGGTATNYNLFGATTASGVTFSNGSATPFYVVQLTALVNKYIRYE